MFNLLIVVVAPVNPLITQYKLPLRVRSETSSSLSAPSGRLDKTESKSGVECWLVHQEQMGQLKGGGTDGRGTQLVGEGGRGPAEEGSVLPETSQSHEREA